MSEVRSLRDPAKSPLSLFMEDPRSTEIAKVAVEGVGLLAFDAAGAAWDGIKDFFSRPPAAEPPPSAQAAPVPVPAPQEALPGPQPGTGAAEPENVQDRVVGSQGESLELLPGVDPNGVQVFVVIRENTRRPE